MGLLQSLDTIFNLLQTITQNINNFEIKTMVFQLKMEAAIQVNCVCVCVCKKNTKVIKNGKKKFAKKKTKRVYYQRLIFWTNL